MIAKPAYPPLPSVAVLLHDGDITRNDLVEFEGDIMSNTPTLPVAFVAKIVAGDGHAHALSELLAGAVSLANEETGTVVWFAVRSDESTFWIFDAFPSVEARTAHAEGAIVAALLGNAHLLAGQPEINAADVLAMKLP